MSTLTERLKHGAEHARSSLAEGWHELRTRASGALTRFRREGARTGDAEGPESPLSAGWGLMAADVRIDGDRVVVRLEAPGMSREDFRIDMLDDRLVVSGEKRLDRESGSGAYRMLQCAYGSFVRELALPFPVDAAQAQASYRDGVLRIEAPRLDGGGGRRIPVRGA